MKRAVSVDPFAPGTVVADRYRLVRRLGQGGMGRVYLADDLRLGQPVALKFLPPEWSDDPALRRRFLDEVRFARQVTHPNVCRVHDLGEAEGRLFLSMEPIDGEDLRALLARAGPLPPERALGIGVAICRGLAAIHEGGLLHRDLKPANVMIDASGRARLTDFGLASPARAAAGDGAGGDSPAAGTPAYLAPELLVGEPATTRTDLYALGLVLHELFTGGPACPRHALLALARRREDPAVVVPPGELSLAADLDPDAARVIRHCLATEPRERPASARAVVAMLRPRAGWQPGTHLAALVAIDPAGGGEGMARALLAEHGGREAVAGGGWVWLFERPWTAVCFVFAWRRSPAEGAALARAGVHLGEVTLGRRDGALRAAGPEVAMARRLAGMARPGQTLLSPPAFDLARHHAAAEAEPAGVVRWLSHGRYRLAGRAEPMEVFEVGVEGGAPFLAPENSEGARAVAEDFVRGWRPAPGVEIPRRPGWRIERKLGEGGFGDVWLARALGSGEPRVFKFCYDPARLRALKREIIIFRLLGEELGERPDITHVLGWSFDEAPYFIESEYASGGSLAEWAETQGGLDRVPLSARLEIVAQVAAALAAAHAVGVLHKDVKPGNILIEPSGGGEVRARLGDFGIGAVLERERLEAAGITVAGLTETVEVDSDSSGPAAWLYLAPEILEDKPATARSDIYALGVVLYQMVLGDLSRVLAPGWQRDVDDELLREDIALAVDGSPARRLGAAADLAARLRSLAPRRDAREAERQALRRAARARRQRRLMAAALVVLAVLAVTVSAMAWRVAREARRAEREAEASRRVARFLVEMFESESAGDEVTARDILDRGARRLETDLADQPEVRARLMSTVGRVYQRLGLYDPARALFEKALALRRETLGAADPAVAESLHDLALLYEAWGKPEQAAEIRARLARRP